MQTIYTTIHKIAGRMYNLALLIPLDWKYIIALITIISNIQVVEADIPLGFPVVKAWVHVALHLMKQVQIVHQLVKDIATTTLQKTPQSPFL